MTKACLTIFLIFFNNVQKNQKIQTTHPWAAYHDIIFEANYSVCIYLLLFLSLSLVE